jgi:hypothetical protein
MEKNKGFSRYFEGVVVSLDKVDVKGTVKYKRGWLRKTYTETRNVIKYRVGLCLSTSDETADSDMVFIVNVPYAIFSQLDVGHKVAIQMRWEYQYTCWLTESERNARK